MIDIATETILTLADAAKEVPNRTSGRGVNVSTVWRWSLRGIRGIRLETAMCGGTRVTSREALQRFFARTTAVANGEEQQPATDPQRRRALERVNRELDAAGI